MPNASTDVRNVAIIGSGPAGLTSAIYTARAHLNPLILGGVAVGGQLMTTSVIENFPGFVNGIEGPELMMQMMQQAQRFGAELLYEDVTAVDFSTSPFTLMAGDVTYKAHSVIIAIGSTPRRLGLPSEEQFWGKGVSTCATCDGAFYKDKTVAVIGGGDSAMEEASFLTRFASKVYVIHRRDEFRASQIMQDRVLKNPKIEVVWNSAVTEIVGDTFVTGLTLQDTNTQATSHLPVDGMFLAIGHVPQTGFLKGQIDLDEAGYIVVHDDVLTSKEGVFVAGDVADPLYRQAITAAGEGCKAALRLEKYLTEIEDRL